MVPWLATALINIAASYIIGKINKPKEVEQDENLTYEKDASIEDFRQPTCEYGTPIAKVFGTCILNGQMLTNSAVNVREVVQPSNNTYGGAGGAGGYTGSGDAKIGTASGAFQSQVQAVPDYVINYYSESLDKHVYAYPGSTEAINLMAQGYKPFDTYPADDSIMKTVPYTASYPAPQKPSWGGAV